MTLRDAGLISFGFVAGFVVASAVMAAMAADIDETDRFIRALRLKYGGRIQGQG